MEIYLGFDISTTCIGISLFTDDGNLLEIRHLVLESDSDVLPEHRFIAKANIFKDYIEEFKKYKILDIFIEEPLGMSNNQNTSNLLMKFNGVCSYILYNELNILPKFKSVHDIRKLVCPELVKPNKQGKLTLQFPKEIDKKDYIFNKMKNKYKNIEWLYNKKGKLEKYNYDMSDAIAVTASFLIEKNIIKKWL